VRRKTKKAVVEEALRRMVEYGRQVAAVQALKGSADWQGDLRNDRISEEREQ
jgi:Arc/MetJ family transcription regulator